MSRRAALPFLLALVAGPVLAEPSDTFLDLARRVPLSEMAAEPGAVIHFSDLRVAAAASTDPKAPWQRAGPPALAPSVMAGLDGDWAPRVGFGPADVEAILGIEAPPRRALVMRLDVAASARVAPALRAAGYAEDWRDGVAAFARGKDDLTMDLARRDPADPFGGELGQSSRVALDGSVVLQSNEWPLLLALAAEPVLNPRLDAFAAALDLPEWGGAEVVQAVFWLRPLDFALDVPAGLLLEPVAEEAPRARLLDGPAAGIPPWSLGLLADLGTAEAPLALVLLAYADRTSAETAADRLATAFPVAESMIARQALAELTGATAETLVTDDGPFVTVLALRGEPDGSGGDRAFRVLLREWRSRSLTLFGPG